MTQGPINVVTVENLGGYRLRLRFDDGTVQTLSFHSFLSHSSHPDLRAFLEPERFAAYRIEYGDLIWGDYELCFPIMDLYRNQIAPPTPCEFAA
jgi:hypothetical protein